MTYLMVMAKTSCTTMSGVSAVESVSSSTNVGLLMNFDGSALVETLVKVLKKLIIKTLSTEFIADEYNSIVITNKCIGTSIQINGPPAFNVNYNYPSCVMSTVYHSIIAHLMKSIKYFNINVNAVLPLTEVK